MVDPNHTNANAAAKQTQPGAGRQLLLGLLFGLAFGFLLQKGGVAKFHILIGVLLLEDFTVIKVMLSAILVGMIGIYAMRRLGLVELHLKPTRYGANSIGGLIFGAGFALSAYCPGTAAAALGQGNLDASMVIVGMLLGSYVYAELSGRLAQSLETWGNRGNQTLMDLLRLPPFLVIAGVSLLILIALVLLRTI